MSFKLSLETPLQDDVRAMVQELNDILTPLSPLETQFKLTAEQMAEDETSVFVLRDDDGAAVGMGSLKVHADKVGEVKRMFTRSVIRGKGFGKLIVKAIEAKAEELKLNRLVLETGATPGFEAAWKVYENQGFTRCGAVLDYPDSEYNRFYEKKLTQ